MIRMMDSTPPVAVIKIMMCFRYLDMERGCTMTAPFYSLATIACLLIFRLPHRILHRLHPIIRLLGGDTVFHRLFGDGDRDGGG